MAYFHVLITRFYLMASDTMQRGLLLIERMFQHIINGCCRRSIRNDDSVEFLDYTQMQSKRIFSQ